MIYFPCATADAAGAIAAAAAYPAAAQRHGAPGPKSFRWRGQHPAARSAPEEAPRAFATRHQPGEGLDLFTLCACLPVCPRCFDQWTLCLSQHPNTAVAPVDEEGSDGEPDQEAVQR